MNCRIWTLFLSAVVIILIFPISVLAHYDASDSCIITTIQDPMVFNLTGAVGAFKESISASYSVTVRGNKNVAVQFTASDLSYVGNEWAKLDVAYWVNNDSKHQFFSGRPLVLGRGKGTHDFSLHGQVTIHAIEAQPAGSYQGTITITVFEDKWPSHSN